jgi:hypothetical protein
MIRFIDIQNPSLRFLHRWLCFTVLLLFPSLNAFLLWCIGLSTPPVADIVGYFKEIRTLSGPIECTSLVTHIALNIGCPEMHKVAYIEGEVPTLGLSPIVHTHVLREEPDHSVSKLYEGGNKVL